MIDQSLQGLIIGISIAAPVGPIGAVCIRRTLAEGCAAGIASGLGASTVHAAYACAAGLGLTLLSGMATGQQLLLRLVGGLFLFYLGITVFLTHPPERALRARGRSLVGTYAATFRLALVNPMTICASAALFIGFAGAAGGDRLVPVGRVGAAVFLGSAIWWLILTAGVAALRDRFTIRWTRWVNRVSGLALTGFGLFSILLAT